MRSQRANAEWTGAWAKSGLAYLTGPPDGAPDFSRACVLERAQRIAPDAATLLTGRAGLLGLTRGGRVSAGGATRLLECRDGWCAITLSRPDDVAALSALLCDDDVPDDPWPVLRRWAERLPMAEIVERAELLDIPAAALGEATAAAPVRRRISAPAPARPAAGLLVADLSSLWAGPLSGYLLARAGATVIKVESPRRPDGTRAGEHAFFDWINAGKLSCCLDFDRQADELRELLTLADIVIESSRPDGLLRRHLGPDDLRSRAGRIWVRIRGHDSRRPAFGDDAAVAGGLVGRGPVFCGDAIADPLTGLEVFRSVTESLSRGGGELIEVCMAAVAATYAALPTGPAVLELPAPAPSAPPVVGKAAALGADNDAVRNLVAKRRCPC
ncbi:CoA transferase [Mycobacterium vicinigordonae]|uniref:CoA transferase n=1 Tax=Mycobacterium vicinigordonae TaxID=1719132 RepID=UPI001FEA0469|nr:CoA transferase [Mycobacterium vicinigordonae]